MKLILRIISFSFVLLALYCPPSLAFLTQEDIFADDPQNAFNFGGWYSKALYISGDYAIVGAPGDITNGSRSGAAYIYQYDGANWLQQQKITPSIGKRNDEFGLNVSISGTNAIVGAHRADGNASNSGSAYIFSFDGTQWVEQELIASDGKTYDNFGISVSISGDNAIVGAYTANDYPYDYGAAYIYSFDGTKWIEKQVLTPSDGSKWFGYNVSISGDYAIVGAPYDDDLGQFAGAAYVFHFDGSKWVEQQKILDGDDVGWQRFGMSVSISGTKAVIAAPLGSGKRFNSGAAYVYTLEGDKWIEQQKIYVKQGSIYCADMVSISGDLMAINGVSYGRNSRYVFLYRFNGKSWKKQEIFKGSYDTGFGTSFSLADNKIIIGSQFGDVFIGSKTIYGVGFASIYTLE